MVDVFMALLSFRGFDTPSLSAQGEQRRSTYFNISRDIPEPHPILLIGRSLGS
jgi:hypothetical protein